MSPGTGKSRGRFNITGLRTRYFPKSRIGHGLVSVAPWLDILLLLFFFVLLESKFLLHPGLMVELPESEFVDGSRPGLIAVVLSTGAEGDVRRQEVLFFDDERYVLHDKGEMDRFRDALAGKVEANPGIDLILEADRRVKHGTVVELMNMALKVGIDHVNVGERPEPVRQ
jgi:biopolymer transport protein ExbD